MDSFSYLKVYMCLYYILEGLDCNSNAYIYHNF